MAEIKVGYLTTDGFVSKAYIDENTCVGENKWTGKAVSLAWDEDQDIWVDTTPPEEEDEAPEGYPE